MKRCSRCHAEYPDTFKVCPQDGAKLDDETLVVDAPTVPVAMVPPAPSDPMIGRTIAGRFRIERKLGEGGMGAVYKAEHVKMNRSCAIKILSSSALNDPEALPRFTREAQMSSRIEHPHAIGIYDFGESEDGIVYLAMEYVDGETLTKVLERDGRFGLERSLKIARQIGQALDAAHALSIVHRDLKPDNIMLSRKATDPEFVKVLDFGIAKMTESEDKRYDLTQAGLIIGTPFYMSPEQVSGEKLDPRSDIFSFGLIVYEMLTGELPFGGQNTQAVMVSRLTTSPRPPRAIDPTIPPQVEAAVLHALERDRERRTPSAGQFVEELVDAAEGRGRDMLKAQTHASTAAHTKPDTAQMRPPVPTPQSAGSPTVPVAQGPFTPQQPQAPLYPTDRAPNVPSYGPNPGPAPFAPQPTPQAGYPPVQPAYQPYAPAAKKGGGGAAVAVGVLLVLLLLGGVAAVALVGYKQGWFGTAGTGPNANVNVNSNTALPVDTASAEELFQQGYQLQASGDRQGAILKYRAALAKDPKLTKAHRNLGAALVDAKQYSEAIRELETALEQDPKPNPQVYYNLGLANFKLKEYVKAGDFFKRASVDDPEAHALAGFALDNANDQAGADAEYKAYLAKSPTGQWADMVRGILSGKVGVPDADKFDL
jgi:serine/threonine-protein kinase